MIYDSNLTVIFAGV